MQIIFDPKDPAVQEMISQWEDGGKYYVTLNVTQDSGETGAFTVDEVVDYGDAPTVEEVVEEEAEEEVPEEMDMGVMKEGGSVPKAARKAAVALAEEEI